MIEGLISFIILLIVVGVLAWATVTYVIGNLPLPQGFKQLIVALVYLIAILIVVHSGLPLIGIALF